MLTITAAEENWARGMESHITDLAVVMFPEDAANLARHQVEEKHLPVHGRCCQIPPIARDFDHPRI